ncbi:hypothetical protein DIPPA_01939 [Diplonema papillatum]|nr:hypothetical protein DIPPA_01939 [Diplonema papillatum]
MHTDIGEAYPSLVEPSAARNAETLHARVRRADELLKQYRESRRTVSARKERVPLTRASFAIEAAAPGAVAA